MVSGERRLNYYGELVTGLIYCLIVWLFGLSIYVLKDDK